MLSYETISDALLDSAEQAGLNVWQSEELLDPHSMQRTFTLTCLPPGHTTARSHSIQASLSFRWDAAMAAISTLGTEALCERYHNENVACSHGLVGCAYDASLALEVTYTIPLHTPMNNDLLMLPRLVRAVQDTHRGIIDHKNIVNVEAAVQVAGDDLRVGKLKAKQIWTIGDPIHELDGLEDVFEDVCSEVRDLLTLLMEQFASAKLPDIEEVQSLLPVDIDDERIYLRPPAA